MDNKQILPFKRIIAIILISFNISIAAEVITPDYSGFSKPTGWIPHRSIERPKIGLALSGGGMRGLAHIGVLQALDESGIEIDYIAGVSMGAVVGALYSSGYSSKDLNKLILDIDWGELLTDKPSRRTLFFTRKRNYGRHILQVRFIEWKPYIPASITSGQKVTMLFDGFLMNALYHPEPDFDHLKVPFRAPATDLLTGDLVLFKDGDLSEVLRASISFPLLFSPVELRGRILVDGGAVENIPVSTVKQMGADIIIAVDISSPLTDEIDDPWEIANQVTTIMIADEMERALSNADLVLKPLPDSIGSFDFSIVDSIPRWSKEYTLSQIDTLRKIIESKNIADSKEYLKFTYIVYQIPSKLQIVPQDTTELCSRNIISKTELQDHLNRLYCKYELEHIEAELMDNKLHIRLIIPPSYSYLMVKGNKLLSDSLIIEQIHSLPGEPLYHSVGLQDRERIIALYRKHGYALASITSSTLSGDTLIININEGIINHLSVQGGRHSSLNDLGLKPGEAFNWFKVRKGLNRLYGSDIYESVRLNAIRNNKDYDLTLILDRRAFPLIRLGARYDLERKFKVMGEVIYEDILGSGTSTLISVYTGSEEKHISAEISADRIMGTYLSFNSDVTYQDFRYPLYNKEHNRLEGYRYERSWWKVRIGQHLFRWGMLSAALRMERTLSTHPTDNPDLRTAVLIFESSIDTYDRYPFPHSGQALYLSFLTAGDLVPGELKYTKFSGNFERWIQLKKRWCLMLNVRGGYAEPTIPTYEKFTLGGLNNFSGMFHREMLGNQLLCGGLALRYDLLSRFLAEAFITLRYDFGQIVDGTDEIQFRRGYFRQGLGISFALNTVIGPIELAYGWVAPYQDIPQNHVFYFSIGYAF